MDTRPLVSVITATYNRSNVLGYSIKSVIAQSLTDWEMLIVGDACSDDTEEVVHQFHDPRIHFFNLPHKAGDQSGPNNEGFRLARGRYIAYLNHDDLWFSDHLSACVKSLEETGADLVWPLIVKRRTDGHFTCSDLNDNPRYSPHLVVPASLWVLRRELVEDVGPWRHHTACHAAPSQDWLYRAYRSGKHLRYISRFTAILLPSGGRPGAYANRESLENAEVFNRMANDPHFRETVLLKIAELYSMQQTSPPVWQSIINTYRDLVRRALARYWGWPSGSYTLPIRRAIMARLMRGVGAAGLHPMACEFGFKYRRKGNFIRYLRRFRGLPADPRDDAPGTAGAITNQK